MAPHQRRRFQRRQHRFDVVEPDAGGQGGRQLVDSHVGPAAHHQLQQPVLGQGGGRDGVGEQSVVLGPPGQLDHVGRGIREHQVGPPLQQRRHLFGGPPPEMLAERAVVVRRRHGVAPAALAGGSVPVVTSTGSIAPTLPVEPAPVADLRDAVTGPAPPWPVRNRRSLSPTSGVGYRRCR